MILHKSNGPSARKMRCALACLILFALAGCTDNKKTQWWHTYVPSEFMYQYGLHDDGTCELEYSDQYDEINYGWSVSNCRWTGEENRLALSFGGETSYRIETGWDASGRDREISRKAFEFPPVEMTYTIDEGYINGYLENIYGCDYHINGIRAMVPDDPEACKDDWCRYPVFRIKDGFEGIDEQMSANSCK